MGSEKIVNFLASWIIREAASDLLVFSHSVMSISLQHHGLQHVRPPCPSPIPRVSSNTSLESMMPFNHLILSFLFSSCPQSWPASGSFPRSQLFASGGQSIGVWASASVLPMNIQDWFPLGLTGLILQSKGLSRVFSNTTVQKHQFFGAQASLWSNSPFMLLRRKAMTNTDSVLKRGDKGLYSQSCGFSSSHVWMWDSVWELHVYEAFY